MIFQVTYLYRLFFILSVTLFSACSGNATKPEPKAALARPVLYDTNQIKDTNVSKPASNDGGYYKDDGPGENAPNLDAIADPSPKAEVPIIRANKPYRALGQSYQPMTTYVPYKMSGKASWYGKRFHGQKTASGEIYNMYAMTAAHTILPLTSYAKVTNPENGKSVIVRVNDRGPFHNDRLIDLSYAAAYKLGILAKGSSLVEVEAIDTRTAENNSLITSRTVSENITPPVKIIPKAGVYLQAGVFKSRENADKISQKIIQQNQDLNVAMQTWYNAGIYRVWLGPFTNEQDARVIAPKLKPAVGKLPIVVKKP